MGVGKWLGLPFLLTTGNIPPRGDEKNLVLLETSFKAETDDGPLGASTDFAFMFFIALSLCKIKKTKKK